MSPSQSTDDRGASELVGVVLLFAFVFAGATLVFTFGMQASDALQGQTQVETAETSMQEVQSRLASLSSGSGESVKNFDISGANADDVTVVQEGNVTFQINGHTACTARMPMGSIVYEEDDTTVAYQAGGVWKQTQSGSSMVSAPALSYKKATVDGHPVYTIDFPMVNVDGSIDSGSVEAKKNATKSKQARKEMERSLCLRGPKTSKISENGVINVQNVTITVEGTRYYEAWSRYLQDEFGATATVKTFDANQSVVVANATLGQVTGGDDGASDGSDVAAYQNALFTVGNGELVLNNKVVVDSYDSAEGAYAVGDANGELVTDGDLKTKGQATIEGNAIVDGSVTLQGASSITGDLTYNGSLSGGSRVSGSTSDSAAVTAPAPVTGAVEANLSTLKNENHNGRTSVITGNDVVQNGEIGPGQYYVENFRLDDSDDVVTLNATDGPIVVGVNQSFVVGVLGGGSNPPELNVIGDHQVVFFVRDSVTVRGQGKVTTPGDRSGQFWTYCTETCSATFTSKNKNRRSVFTGVLYAPTSGSSGSVTINQAASVYGAVVGGPATVDNHANLHFDRALLEKEPPKVSLATDVSGPADGGDAIDTGGDGEGGEPNGTVGVNETVEVGDKTYELESFDVEATLLGTELSGIDSNAYDFGPGGYFPIPSVELEKASNPEGELQSLDYHEWEDSVVDDSDQGVGSYQYESFTISGRTYTDDSDDQVTVSVVASKGDPTIEVYEDGSYLGTASGSGKTASGTFTVDADSTYEVRVVSSNPAKNLEYNVTLTRESAENAPIIINAPIRIQLRTEKDGSKSVYEPWPAEESSNAHQEHDTNWPTTDERQTYEIEDVPGGSSFTVYATSYTCDYEDYVYTGNSHTISGYEVFDVGCSDDSRERLSINADANSNKGNVKILRDGADLSDITGGTSAEQRSFKEMLGPHLNDTGHLQLAENEVVFLFELSEEDAEWEDRSDSGDPDYNDAVILYEFEDFQWTCVENCTDPSTDGGDGGGDGGGDAGDSEPSVTNPDNSLDGEGPQDNTYVIRITNSQVVVESESDSDD